MEKLKFTLLSLCFVLFSCKNDMKFEKSGWNQKGDLNSYKNRENMLEDLTNNHKLKGISYSKVIDLLGLPENYSDEKFNTLSYNIVTEYGNDIDPVYIKILEIKLTKDSIVENYKIVEIEN
ncbi:Probable lipoprotein precursor [Flavobacterium indicum GPTSA100-9 = DSM 17447]|uniref:Probable lipoprotein n=1 Tax=Flavobacterium indicum (strain DSM 17447 / CIP 109464 / GPTSA100-9) TaxID=1094466 RepID=H8XUG8_FLAIG|nr:hypothetical protein [Flavobacterium indicum]CCG52951.1 Probable lipoprotein precursor [Flavobacterium indicum GPTSA100-9 = DSM 17447]